MITENNWITTNIKQRGANTNLDFKVTMTPYPYQKMSFTEASDAVAKKIAALNKPIYIGFSGGMDSEYVVRTFMKNNIPFKTVTVSTGGNGYEQQYVDRFLYEFPAIVNEKIDLTNPKKFMNRCVEVFKTYNTLALGSIGQIEAAKYAKQKGGIFIIGEHFIGQNNKANGNIMVEANEWDFYCDYFVDDNLVVPFFMYDINIVESYVSKFDNTKVEYFKEKIYSIPFRPKFYNHFINKKFGKVFDEMKAKMKPVGKKDFTVTKQVLLNIIKG
jgi:hypothetical protein